MDQSLRAIYIVLNQSAFIVEDHIQPLKIGNIEKATAIKNSVHISIHGTKKTNVVNVRIEIQIRASDMDQRITILQIFQNRNIQKTDFSGTWTSLKLVRTTKNK